MVTSPLWKSLKQLVELDTQKDSILFQVNEIEQKIDEDGAILPELQTTIDQIKQNSIDAKKNVDLQELNAKDLKSQEQAKRKTLESITKEKEYSAIEKELNSITQQISEQDDALMQAWHNLEAAKSKESVEITKIEEQIEVVKKDIETKKEEITTLHEKLSGLEEKIEKHMEQIPAEWLKKYNRTKGKVSDPVVPLINKSCSSCYYSVPPQDIMLLKRSAILHCRSCYRFLYYDKEEETDIAKSTF